MLQHHSVASAALTLQIKAVLQVWGCSLLVSSVLLLQHAFQPPASSSLYPPPRSLLLLSFSALSLLIYVEMVWCLCCQRQHSQSTAPWETCKSAPLSTQPPSFLFSLFIDLINIVSGLFLLYNVILAETIFSLNCLQRQNTLSTLHTILPVEYGKNTFSHSHWIEMGPHI